MQRAIKLTGIILTTIIILSVIAFTTSQTVRNNTYYVGAVGTNYIAKHVCSEYYLNGNRSINDIFEQDIYTTDKRFALFDVTEDKENKTIHASLWGLFHGYAAYRDALGCTLVHDMPVAEYPQTAVQVKRHERSEASHKWPLNFKNAENIGEIDMRTLSAAVDKSFSEPNPNSKQDTRALVILHKGNIVAEKYAPGFDQNSRFFSMSLAKSVSATLIGTLVDAGKINLNDTSLFPEWSAQSDPRRDISLHHLLTMTSGLEFEEVEAAGYDLTNMVYLSSSMAEYAKNKPLIHQPGTHWDYSSGTATLISALYTNHFDNLETAYQYAWDTLFAPADMVSTIYETDQNNDFDGGGWIYAAARDWARFGQLYLNRGIMNDQRIVSEKWVDYISTPVEPAPIGIYGGQFWLNKGAKQESGETIRFLDSCPSDLYFALGHFGQIIAIIPSKDAVIVRLGWSTDPENQFDFDEHICGIASAIESTQ